MNKKILVSTVLLLAVALLTFPVMAAPATKIEGVTVTAVVTQSLNPGFPHLVSHDTIGHGKGTSTGTVTINIPGQQDPLVGDWDGKWISKSKLSLDPAELSITGKMVWTFPEGTFEGIIQRMIIGLPIGPSSIFIDRLVLHGTGEFRGQTLKLSFEGTPPIIQEGCLIMPK